MKTPLDPGRILAIERPEKVLWTYYVLRCLLIPPLFPIVILPSYFRYHTMRFRFTEEGVSMSWGILFRREIILNYARIQDIHLRSNLVERWLGLSRILVQTASGNSSAEMTIEGLRNFEEVRDFLYSRMRGVKDPHHMRAAVSPAVAVPMASGSQASDELAAVLREVAAEIRALREELVALKDRQGGGGPRG